MPEITSPADREPCSSCGVILDVGPPVAMFSVVRCPHCLQQVRVRRSVGSYQLADVLGQGGSGTVFRARQAVAVGDVALKVIEKNIPGYEEQLQQLRNEALFARLVEHPRVVKVFSLEEDEKGARIAMELMDGGSLHDKIHSREKLSEDEVLLIGLQIVKALVSAHSKEIIHLDLKPANILFSMGGGAKLGDFGLARSTEANPVAQSHLLTTPDYVSPEVLAGSHGDLRSDIYSLGSCLFHALTGTPPYETEGLTLMELQSLKARAVFLHKKVCSRRTRVLVARMMAPDPSRRFHSYRQLEKEILSILESSDRVKENHGDKMASSTAKFFWRVFRHWKRRFRGLSNSSSIP